jgi:MFS family permease
MSSANSSTTNVSVSNANVEVLEKIESQHPGEYSPAPSAHSSRPSSIVDKLEKGENEPPQGPQPITHRPTGVKWVLIIVAILVGLFLFALDNTIVADVQPAIVEEFQAVDQISWLATGFFLSGTALMLPFGQLFQVFNAKWLYIWSVLVFEVGSAICGGAPNMNALIVGRVIAGIGATGIYTGSLFLISVNTNDQERPAYIGLTGAMWGLGTVLGPVIGGAFTDSSAGWRWAFYINLPIGALIAPVLIFLVPTFDAQKGTSFWGRVKMVDWIGATLLTGTIVSIILALTFGGNEFAWNSGQVIGTFVSFGVLAILFAFSQTTWMPWQTKERRVFPVEMLFMRTTVLLFILIATSAALAFVTLYYIPLYFQFTRGDSALKSAVRLLPVIFTLVFGSVAGGIMISKFGFYSPFYIFGTALGLIGSALLHVSTTETSAARIYGYTALIGLGAGVYSQAGFAVAQAKVDPKHLGQAIGFLTTGQLTGAVVSLTIGGTVLINNAASGLSALLPDVPEATIKNAIAGTAGNFFGTLDPATRAAALDVIVNAIDKVYILTITAGAVGFVASLLLKHERIFVQGAVAAA